MIRIINKSTKHYLNKRFLSTFKSKIENSINERNKLGVEAEILKLNEVEELITELKNPEIGEESFLLNQFKYRILPGVDETSKLKANFLLDIAEDRSFSPLIDKIDAIDILGSMQGGYSIEALVKLLTSPNAMYASENLKKNILIFDYFYTVEDLYKNGNPYAKELLESWANAEWFKNRSSLPEKITLTCFKVDGEINTDDLSPAPDAWSRPDIPLHAQCMLKNPRPGIEPDKCNEIGPIETINWLKQKGNPIVFVGDVLGTGSSRKSATNSILWHFGNDIPYVPNKRNGGYCIGNKIAPIFFNTMEDSGALALEMPVTAITKCVKPESLIDTDLSQFPHLQGKLAAVYNLMQGLNLSWGYTGSVGFELATGLKTVNENSDIDLLIRAQEPVSKLDAQNILGQLDELNMKLDVQLQTPQGGVALREWAGTTGNVLLKRNDKAVLIDNPWS